MTKWPAPAGETRMRPKLALVVIASAVVKLTVVHVLWSPPEGWTGERGFINA